ncbi:MAG: rRNA pseudouridine synthase [Desulfobacter sp.]|nr:rRNA pseudouridine synthase [Desulfobacter sp.]WDP86367.1 MAG: rRNA pseudouridine synthase [Desulfobacter sp.]
MRLQKYLAHAGVCSRRKAEALILDSRIKVNGELVTTLGTQVDPETDQVLFDNQKVAFLGSGPKLIYIAVNKPQGVVTSCSQKNTKIILDLVPVKDRIYPIGRLDKDSVGLVLLTNDGHLHNRLSHPSHDHEKEYLVFTRHPVSDKALGAMAEGMVIEGEKTRRAQVKRVAPKGFKIILKQGRNRQIRKMVGKTGNKVDTLKRVRMANINLGSLKPGKWRYLTDKEVKILTQ